MLNHAQIDGVRLVVSTVLPTKWGTFQALGFEGERSKARGQVESAIALVLGEMKQGTPLVRIHSQCITGELFGSQRCDCGDQLEKAMQMIVREGRGVLIYEFQEGRGIGLINKLRAYSMQDMGLDTVEANHALGFAADARDFSLAAAILYELGISQVRLISNNPQKARALIQAGIEVVEPISCETAPNHHSLAYLKTKREKLGHRLTHAAKETEEQPFEFATIEDAIRELQAGRMIVVVDDEDRENEGDLTMAAEMITPEAVNFMVTHGRGLICLAMTGERLEELDIAPMTSANSALGGTAFTVSIDANTPGMTTGISARDRAQTIKAAVNADSRPEDFARPGHIFPLRAKPGGVLERRGQTEAAVDLASLAGLYPAGVICEIINDDGTMARVPDLIKFCRKLNLVMITVAELARYRFENDFEGSLAAIDGIFPVCHRHSAQGTRRFEPADLCLAGTTEN